MPSTPTPLPPGMAHFNIPSEYSLWGSTDLALQTWNWLGDDAQVIVQSLAIIMLVIAGMYIVIRAINMMTRKDSEE